MDADTFRLWSTRAAITVVIALFGCALLFNHSPGYRFILWVLAVFGAVTAASSTQAALILVTAAPALDSFAILTTWPQVVTIFQVVLIAAVLGLAFRLSLGREPLRQRLSLWDLGILLFLLAALISVPLSRNVSRSVIGVIEIAALVAMYALLSRAEPWVDSSRRIRFTVVSVGALSGVVALGQTISPTFPVPLLERDPSGSSLIPLRASGFFANPNSLAALLVLAALVAAEFALKSRSLGRGSAWVAATLACTLGIALSFSREALIGLFVGILALILIASPSRRRAAASFVAVLVLTGCMLAAPGVGQRVRSIYDFRADPSSLDRVYLSHVSIRMFEDHPATGVGLSAFMWAYPQYRDPRVTVSPVTDGHQTVFSIPAETGIVGLIAELIMVGGLCALLLRARSISAGGVSVSAVASACAFFAMSFFNVFYYAEYFWVTLALVSLSMQSAGVGKIFARPEGWQWPAFRPSFAERGGS